MVEGIGVLLIAVAVAVAAIVGGWLVFAAARGVGALTMHLWRFVSGVVRDLLRCVGALVVACVVAPLIVLSVVIGRWSAASHYGRALSAEVRAAAACLYRVFIGHPARLIGLRGVAESVERRLVDVVAAAPTRDRPVGVPGNRAVATFEGYEIVGSLAGGGSGGKLYVAEPLPAKLAAFAKRGQADVGRVVIKSFSLADGSSLPQIVRESRALDAARNMGLVLEHELTPERFFYVTRFVPGDSLTVATGRLHAQAGPEGLGGASLARALGYVADLLATLKQYHEGGLWHKDVKPDNIIVDAETGRAHLVDLGLVTPLRSAMTLTTHGTEYFRDPELVRQALRGVKVHQIDGARFDVYAVGAVLFSVVENSFPAHGGLSRITKRCPESLRWIVRRAMTEYDKRYATCAEMLADVVALLSASDPFAFKPAELPSMRGGGSPAAEAEPEWASPAPAARAAAFSATPPPLPPAAAGRAAVGGAARPHIRVTGWWTGRYRVAGGAAMPGAEYVGPAMRATFAAFARAASAQAERAGRRAAPAERAPRRTAAQQLASARERVARRRANALDRMRRRQGVLRRSGPPMALTPAVVFGLVFAMAVLFAAGMIILATRRSPSVAVSVSGGEATWEAAWAEAERQWAAAEEKWDRAEEEMAAAFAAEGHTAAHASSGIDAGDRPEAPAPSLSGFGLFVAAPGPLSADVRDRLASEFAPLAAAGAEPLGQLAAANAPASMTDTIARARLLRAEHAGDDEAFYSALLAMDAESDDIDAVLWIAPGDSIQNPVSMLSNDPDGTDSRLTMTTAANVDAGWMMRFVAHQMRRAAEFAPAASR